MRSIIMGLIALITWDLNAQIMNKPNEVVIALFVATDQRDWSGVRATFDEKVWLDYSSMNGSPATELTPEQIITAWQGILPGFESTHHQLGNFIHSIDGDEARVFCYGTAAHFLTDEKGNLWTVVGTYDFVLQEKAGDWKISSMKFNFKYQDGNTSLPERAMARAK